jgi:hypothetical protein
LEELQVEVAEICTASVGLVALLAPRAAAKMRVDVSRLRCWLYVVSVWECCEAQFWIIDGGSENKRYFHESQPNSSISPSISLCPCHLAILGLAVC